MNSSPAGRVVLFIVATVMAISTLTGTVVAMTSQEQLANEADDKQEQLAKLSDILAKLQLEKAYETAKLHGNKLAAKIEKKQEEEAKARQAAIAAAKQANVPTVSSNDNCAKPNAHSNPSRIDVIVNKQHCIQPLNFVPSVTSVGCAGGSGTAVIATSAVSDFTAMCQAAKAAGVPLSVTSSYRSYETQIATYNYWVTQGGQTAADRYSARPGYSEHQTGLSVDFASGGSGLDGFTGTPQQKWMVKNAYKYGWIQRYTTANSGTTGYNAESWHYRYIGRSAAASYISSGTSSLEAFWGVSGGSTY